MLEATETPVEWARWPATPRTPAPEPTGPIGAILRTGLFRNKTQLKHVTAMLTSGFPPPPTLEFTPAWSLTNEQCTLRVDAGAYQLRHIFKWVGPRSDGKVEVDFGQFTLDPEAQRLGGARRLMANAILVYEELGIRRIVARANFSHGGYVWAKLAAAALKPDQVRSELLAKLAQLTRTDASLSGKDFKSLFRVVNDAADDSLMFEIACLPGERGDQLGRLLLE
ncbi:MAG TPA: hypothetical protein VF495_14345, partial [Phenylobacterium sp.]